MKGIFKEMVAQFRGGRKMTPQEICFKRELLKAMLEVDLVSEEDLHVMQSNDRSLAILNFYCYRMLEQTKHAIKEGDKDYVLEYHEFVSSGEWKKYLNWDES